MSLLSLQVGSVASGYCNRQVDIAIGIHMWLQRSLLSSVIECGVLAS